MTETTGITKMAGQQNQSIRWQLQQNNRTKGQRDKGTTETTEMTATTERTGNNGQKKDRDNRITEDRDNRGKRWQQKTTGQQDNRVFTTTTTNKSRTDTTEWQIGQDDRGQIWQRCHRVETTAMTEQKNSIEGRMTVMDGKKDRYNRMMDTTGQQRTDTGNDRGHGLVNRQQIW